MKEAETERDREREVKCEKNRFVKDKVRLDTTIQIQLLMNLIEEHLPCFSPFSLAVVVLKNNYSTKQSF